MGFAIFFLLVVLVLLFRRRSASAATPQPSANAPAWAYSNPLARQDGAGYDTADLYDAPRTSELEGQDRQMYEPLDWAALDGPMQTGSSPDQSYRSLDTNTQTTPPVLHAGAQQALGLRYLRNPGYLEAPADMLGDASGYFDVTADPSY